MAPTVRLTLRTVSVMRTGRLLLDRGLRGGDQLVVERAFEAVVLAVTDPDGHAVLGGRLIKQLRQVDAVRFPVIDRRRHVEQVNSPDHLVQ